MLLPTSRAVFCKDTTHDILISKFFSEEVQRAAVAAPSAIFVAVIGTGLIGWLLNIALVLCSGPIDELPGPTGLAFIEVRVWLHPSRASCSMVHFLDHV